MRGFSIIMKIISIACVASVSVRFRRKERGTRVKDRAKNGANIFWLSFYFSSGQNRKSRPSRNFLVTRFMEEMFVFLLTLFFTAAHFYLGERYYFSFSHRRYKIFTFFFQRNWSPLFFISGTSSFPVIHVIYTLKFSRKKDFLSLKVRAAVQFTAETGSVLEMQNFTSTYMKGRTDVRTYVRMDEISLGCINKQIFLPMVLRCARFACARPPL